VRFHHSPYSAQAERWGTMSAVMVVIISCPPLLRVDCGMSGGGEMGNEEVIHPAS
jgi:hypothetical protein